MSLNPPAAGEEAVRKSLMRFHAKKVPYLLLLILCRIADKKRKDKRDNTYWLV